MKVILLQDIKNLGKKYDIKEVSAGYARNFLIPQKLAKVATGAALKSVMELKSKMEAEHEQMVARLKAEAEKIKNKKIIFRVKTGKKGEVFGSVTARDIETALKEEGIFDAKANIAKPFKELGEKEVEISLGEGIKTKIAISIQDANSLNLP